MSDEQSSMNSGDDDTQAITYEFRHNRRAAVAQWHLQAGGLTIEQEGQPVERVDLTRATKLRICKAPSPWDMTRFRCDLVLEDGTRHTLYSTSWIRWGRYENRAESYTTFVKALAVVVAEKAPGCRITGASQPWTYRIMGLLLAFAVILAGLLMLDNPPQGLSWDLFWGLAVPICMLAYIASVLGCVVPESLKADDLDERFLPRVDHQG